MRCALAAVQGEARPCEWQTCLGSALSGVRAFCMWHTLQPATCDVIVGGQQSTREGLQVHRLVTVAAVIVVIVAVAVVTTTTGRAVVVAWQGGGAAPPRRARSHGATTRVDQAAPGSVDVGLGLTWLGLGLGLGSG